MKILLVSIIIPVYNKEKYLNACISSVVKQDYKNIEIIIVNDGSQDGSDRIIREWLSKDQRISYISQNNKGVSYSRNIGISLANGEYVFLLDADDELKEYAISSLVKYAKEYKPDIIIGNYYNKINNKIIKQPEFENKLYTASKLKQFETILEMFVINGRHMATAGNKLYKLDFIKKHELYFVENVIAEDRLFNLMCYVNNPLIYVVNEYTYIYNIIENSRSRSITKNFYEENIAILHYFYKYLKNEQIFEENIELFQLNTMFDIYKIINTSFKYSKQKYGFTLNIIKKLKKDMLIYDTALSVIKKKKYKKFLRMDRYLKIFMINYIFIKSPFLIIIIKFISYYIRKLKFTSK